MSIIMSFERWWDSLGRKDKEHRQPDHARQAFEAGYMAALNAAKEAIKKEIQEAGRIERVFNDKQHRSEH